MSPLKEICSGIPLDPLPEPRPRDDSVAHAPVRSPDLNKDEEKLAIQNALRYFPPKFHEILAPEFAIELRTYGHIYMYRFRPQIEMRAYPLSEYPAKCTEAAAIMHMIMNNLDPRVAQYPHELVTYGDNGQVFSCWAQFLLTMRYLSEMTRDQTLVMYSGHPMGLYPSPPKAPRMVITNGMMVPNYSNRDMYYKLFSMGVTMYGQMTAGSYCYIGPQGIVHGTMITILNAARKHFGTSDLSGKVFVSAGLGGMSGAQAKAAVICGCIGVISEVSKEALLKRHRQGWVMEVVEDLDNLVALVRNARRRKIAVSIGYHGNVVDVWERLVTEYESKGDLLVDLGSDQTSCHNPFHGGYYPVQLSYQQSRDMMHQDPARFRVLIQESISFFLVNLTIDWILKKSVDKTSKGIRWTPFTMLEDLDCADDIALLSHKHEHIQEKSSRLNSTAEIVGMRINTRKTKIITNSPNQQPVTINNQTPKNIEQFTYLGSVVSLLEGIVEDVQSRLNKARTAFAWMKPIWKSSIYNRGKKL